MHLIFFYFSLFYLRPTNLVSYFISESVENARLIRFLTEKKFCSLNEGDTKIKVAKVLKD